MNPKTARALVALLAVSLCGSAFGQELIEKVVVRNRLYTMEGKAELGLNVGLTLLSRLTDHTNLNLDFAYNVSDTFAFELRGGYALSRNTGLANQIREHISANAALKTNLTDLSGLWEM